MRDKMQKKYQHELNKKIRELNTSIENDSLWLGRFYATQVRAAWVRFEDNSGGILYAVIRMNDKKTGKYKDYWVEYFPTHSTLNWHLSMEVGNDFIVEYLDVWGSESPRAEIKDYRKRNVLALELSSKNFKSLPLEKLVKIKEIIEGSVYE